MSLEEALRKYQQEQITLTAWLQGIVANIPENDDRWYTLKMDIRRTSSPSSGCFSTPPALSLKKVTS